jgi:amidase
MGKNKAHVFEPQRYWNYFAPYGPELTISSGDTVTVETPRDCHRFNKDFPPIPDQMKQRSQVTVLNQSNPLVGPIYVEGAEVGDSLEVEILRLELNRPYAYSRVLPHLGSLTGEHLEFQRMLLNEALPDMVFHWTLDLKRMVGILDLPRSQVGRVEVPLEPMLGCIGVAPSLGWIEPSSSQGNYGGNMDCPDVREGCTVILPVWVKGAYLALGDVHARQGDGELTASGMETSGKLTVRVSVATGKSISWPRIVDETHIMVVASVRPLSDAVCTAVYELLQWLMADYGYSKWEGWEVLAHTVTLRIANHVSPRYTVVAKFPRRYLPV